MKEKIRELKDGNIDADLIPNKKISWKQDRCPWNETEGIEEHKCAVKSVSLCKFFRGIRYQDKVLCAYPEKNRDNKQ